MIEVLTSPEAQWFAFGGSASISVTCAQYGKYWKALAFFIPAAIYAVRLL